MIERIFENIASQRMRALMSAAAIAVSVVSLIVLGSLARHLHEIVSHSRAVGERTLIVSVDRTALAAGGASLPAELARRIAGVPGVSRTFPHVIVPYRLDARSRSLAPPVFAIDSAGGVLRGVPLATGRPPAAGEAHAAVVGSDFAVLEGKSAGDVLSLYGTSFRVVAVARKTFSFVDQMIVVSPEDARALVPQILPPDVPALDIAATAFFVDVRDDAEISTVGRRITELSHVRVIDPREQMMIMGSAVGLLDAVTIAIASVAFVTGVLAIVAVMSTAVDERKREIGLRMAVGARRRGLYAEIVGEAVAIGIAGAALGIVLGALSDAALEQLALRQGAVGLFTLAPSVAAGVVVLTLIASVAGALYPARRAISVDPAVALRFVQ